ncbi:hypothetical protein ILYODFUR_017035 [Ilyodon furcidens]|uniref:Uncharacterized protein n=1 Tax=Ilyodon furcidens TaxID=33524 RepID=A0ABV0SZ71_9TELE
MSIININDFFMANLAELTVKQAAALSKWQKIKGKACHSNPEMPKCQLETGQEMPPCLDIEEGWRRILRDKKRRQREKEEKKVAKESKWRQLPNGVYTTAEARPNAYIPEDDPLGLPVPFGRFPPIKPRPQGAHMRHYRNPTIKPLEI